MKTENPNMNMKHDWEGEDFHDVSEYLEAQALKYPLLYLRDLVPIHRKPVKLQPPKPSNAMEEMQLRLQKLKLGCRPRYRLPKSKKGCVKKGSGDRMESGGQNSGSEVERNLVLRQCRGVCDLLKS